MRGPHRVAGRPVRKSRKRLLLVVGLVLVLGLGAGLALLYSQIGRTPGEILSYAERRLQGHPGLERVALPAIGWLRRALDADRLDEDPTPFLVPRLAPNPRVLNPGAAASAAAGGHVIRVGPGQAVISIAAAARLAKDGDVVEIEPGDYVADVAVWERAGITIRGIGQRVRLIASGANAEGKAIWVFRGGPATIENIDFIGARVDDHNGAGVRLETGHLTVRNCLFIGNQNGILTSDEPGTSLDIENSEFGYNGAGDGLSHNLYVGRIRSLTVRGSYFHHANVGHLLKSRAQTSRIEYSRLSDESGGRASYELEFPNGGQVTVIGSIVQQTAGTRNSVIVSYGAEGLSWPLNQFRFVHNTVVNDHPAGGTFVRVAPGAAALLRNNLFVGPGVLALPPDADRAGDQDIDWSYLVMPAREDYRLNDKGRSLPAVPDGAVVDPALQPRYEYGHPAAVRALAAAPRWPGALQGSP